jgi:hypothetical protein
LFLGFAGALFLSAVVVAVVGAVETFYAAGVS